MNTYSLIRGWQDGTITSHQIRELWLLASKECGDKFRMGDAFIFEDSVLIMNIIGRTKDEKQLEEWMNKVFQ